jgi:hypothetical protein
MQRLETVTGAWTGQNALGALIVTGTGFLNQTIRATYVITSECAVNHALENGSNISYMR